MMSAQAGANPEDQSASKSRLAGWILVFLIGVSLPYAWLTEHFGYDDILREPAGVILKRFHEGGSALVMAWLAFAASCLLFLPVALGFRRLFRAHGVSDGGAFSIAIASAVAQTAGLMRWVLVVPALAMAYVADPLAQGKMQALEMMFDVVHRYGGMVLGEFIGQMLLAAWTGWISMQLWRTRLVSRWLAGLGLATLPFWLLGQSELLHEVIPQIPRWELIPLAFMLWQLWLAALALALGASAWCFYRRVPV